MKVKGLKLIELHHCITVVNNEQNYNLCYNRFPEKKGNYLNFTIRSKKSGIPGSRYSYSGRKLVSASWHAHGFLFDEIFKVNPEAIIVSSGKKITAKSGNWIDKNAGSFFKPIMFSELSIL